MLVELGNIDFELLATQKEWLFNEVLSRGSDTEQCELIEGILAVLDCITDARPVAVEGGAS